MSALEQERRNLQNAEPQNHDRQNSSQKTAAAACQTEHLSVQLAQNGHRDLSQIPSLRGLLQDGQFSPFSRAWRGKPPLPLRTPDPNPSGVLSSSSLQLWNTGVANTNILKPTSEKKRPRFTHSGHSIVGLCPKRSRREGYFGLLDPRITRGQPRTARRHGRIRHWHRSALEGHTRGIGL